MELQEQFATMVIPGVKSEETFVPSQGAIGEIKMASILRTTPCPESPTRGLQVAASDSAIEERQSKCDRWKKGWRELCEGRSGLSESEQESIRGLAGLTLQNLVGWRDDAHPKAAWAQRYVTAVDFNTAYGYLQWSEAREREQKERARRRTRLLVGILVFLLIGLASASWMFYHMKRRAEESFAEARKQRATAQELSEDKTQMALALETSAKQLTSVGITKENKIFEVRAAAKATGRILANGPEYNFSIFINAPPDVLSSIQQVTYHFGHETFRQQNYASTNSQDHFREGYTGWGCLSDVTVTVLFRNGGSQKLDFNMCQSLGPDWW